MTSAPRLPPWFTAILAVGLIIRLGILWHTRDLGTPVVDEQHYRLLAGSLLAGEGFAFTPGQPTSLRPPLYPALVAAIWRVAGADNLQAVRAVQILLSLVTLGLVFALGRRAFSTRVGFIAAAVFWLFPAFVFFDFLILTETLYTFLLVGFVLLSVLLVQAPRPSLQVAAACGATLGLACLTRSVLWPLPAVMCPALLVLLRAPLARRIAISTILLLGFVATIGPWAWRNTRLQHVVTIIDTMGGMNLRMGNYEYTPDDRMWDAVALTGERNWAYALGAESHGRTLTEGEKEKWAQGKAIAYIRAHPAETARRALIKFADFWGLEREFIAGVQQGVYRPPAWFAVSAAGAIILSYPLLALVGAAGIWLAPPRDWRATVWMLAPIVAITLAHTIVFGHSRYHVPLLPLFAVFAAGWWTRDRTAGPRASRARLAGAAVTIALLSAIWLRQIVVTDLDRIRSLF